jgi:hypothetical protein
MPRTGHGGRRQGEQGASYSNRTDLNAHVPIATVPDQPYGDRAQQQQAQQTIPMAPTQVASQAAKPVADALPPSNTQRPPSAAPGSLPFLEATQRPNEPVTEGLPFGPGAGPTPPTSVQPNLSDQMMNAALTSGSDTLANLALGIKSAGM